MQSTFIARDTSAASLRSDRLQFAPASLSPSELLREALGLTKRKSDQLLQQLEDEFGCFLHCLQLVRSLLVIMLAEAAIRRTIPDRVTKVMSKIPPTLEDLKAKREKILAIFEKHGATDVKIFGSVARGDATPHSDIDFLCTVPNPKMASPWFPGGLILELEAELGHSIDIGTEAETLASPIGEFIQGDVIAL